MELSSDLRYQILKALEQSPDASQRELARVLGISLGKVNFCLRALIGRGLIKARNFKNSQNKWAYTYLFTPAGLEDKSKVTFQFLRQKIAEVEKLQEEIEVLRVESNKKSRT